MKERETSSSAQKAELRELVFNTKVDTGTPRYRCWINKNKASSAYGGSDGWRETDGGRSGVGRLSSRNTRARTMPVGGATRRHKDTDMPTTFPTSITSIRPLSLPLSLSLSLCLDKRTARFRFSILYSRPSREQDGKQPRNSRSIYVR